MEAESMLNFVLPSPFEELQNSTFKDKGIQVFIKRDDLIHAIVSGNKWRKLKYNIEAFQKGNYTALLTFGGAFSNHIAATAEAGELFGIPTIGVIRGDELNPNSNETLKQASANGMQLVFTNRSEYRRRYDSDYHSELEKRFQNVFIIPEGGANFFGVQGVAEVLSEIPFEPDYILTAAGTGTTTAGLLHGSNHTRVIAVPVLKGGEFLFQEISELLANESAQYLSRLELQSAYHFGGYGKYTPELIQILNEGWNRYKIRLDQVYTGKMFAAFLDLLQKDHFKKGSTVVLLHTGGLQGAKTIENLLDFKD